MRPCCLIAVIVFCNKILIFFQTYLSLYRIYLYISPRPYYLFYHSIALRTRRIKSISTSKYRISLYRTDMSVFLFRKNEKQTRNPENRTAPLANAFTSVSSKVQTSKFAYKSFSHNKIFLSDFTKLNSQISISIFSH